MSRIRNCWRHCLLLGVAALLLPAAAAAKQGGHHNGHQNHGPKKFFVAPNGKDSWPGTKGRPFATVHRAQQAVRALTPSMSKDIVVNLRAGMHRLGETLELSDAAGDSGQNGHRVIYQAYRYGKRKQERVVVSGGRKISRWHRVRGSGGLWRARVGNLETRQLYVNGERAFRARFSGEIPELTITTDGYTTESTLPQSWSQPEDIELLYRNVTTTTWSEPRCGVESISGDATSTTIVMEQPCWELANKIYTVPPFTGGPDALIPTGVENSRSFLTEPGTFYLDRSVSGKHVLYYRPRAGERMRRAKVIAPVLETLVAGNGTPEAPVHDITFRGLTFAHATWLQPNTPHGFLNWFGSEYEPGNPTNPPFEFSDEYRAIPGHLAFVLSDRITLEGNRFKHLGGQALEFIGSENVIRGNVITDTSSGAILMGDIRPKDEIVDSVSEDNVIDNNWIHGVGVEYPAGTAIYALEMTKLTVSNNQVNDMPWNVFVILGPYLSDNPNVYGTQVVDNHVFDAMKVLHDGGGIYLNEQQGSSFEDGAVVAGNVFQGLEREPNFGIYTDLGSQWVTVKENVVFDTWRSAGGCSLPSFDFLVHDIHYEGNFWTDSEPFWGLCAEVEDITQTDHTVLPSGEPEAACLAQPKCAAILNGAGLEPAYQHLLKGGA